MYLIILINSADEFLSYNDVKRYRVSEQQYATALWSVYRRVTDCGRKCGVSINCIKKCGRSVLCYVEHNGVLQSQRLKIKMSFVLDGGMESCL